MYLNNRLNCLPRLLHKFSNVDHHNENIWATGKDGEYKLQEPMENVELDTIKESTFHVF